MSNHPNHHVSVVGWQYTVGKTASLCTSLIDLQKFVSFVFIMSAAIVNVCDVVLISL